MGSTMLKALTVKISKSKPAVKAQNKKTIKRKPALSKKRK
jgi:hypothetical protein